MKRIKYFSKPASHPNTKQFADGGNIDASVVRTLCGVVDGLQSKVAEMSDELAALREQKANVKQYASTEEGETIPEPKGDVVQPQEPIPETVASGVADDPAPAVATQGEGEVPEETVIAQFSKRPEAPKASESLPVFGNESFSCLD